MNKLFAILIMCSLSLPVLAIEEQGEFESVNQNTIEETVPEDVVIPKAEQVSSSKFKQPVSKKKLAKKFVIAMLCVVGTSIFLYGTLSLYNKVRETIIGQSVMPPEGEKPLDAPTDLTEAVKTFLDKTKWNQN